ncbi:MAG: hypothetical protein ACYDD4_03615 [Acidimicrobiales bacterium]
MDRLYELEQIRRSAAMAPPRSKVLLRREEVLCIVGELQELMRQTMAFRDALRDVLGNEADR